MSEKFVETPIEPHSSRRDIADRINRAFSTSDITAICQRLRGVQPSVASSDDHKIALNVRSGSFASFRRCAEHFRFRAVRDVVEIRCGAISGNMKVSFQAARSIG
jgi:hypothetical protein